MSDEFFNYMPFYRYASGITHFSRFVEVGVYSGASCAFMTKQLLGRNIPFEMYAVDLWDKVNAETDYERIVSTPIWIEFTTRLQREHLLQHVRVIQKESTKAAADFADQSLDFVFIDANHSYEHVKADIEAWKPKMKVGGMLSGHDYGEPCGVKQAVDELLPGQVSLMGTCWYMFVR
jgi:cephalosporin hydroxylase